MIQIPLMSDEFLVLAPRWAALDAFAQFGLLAFSLLIPSALIGWLYRYELRLVGGWRSLGMATLRLMILLILWCAIALQPRLLALHIVETPGRVRIAVDLSSSMDIVDLGESKSRRALVSDVLEKKLLTQLGEKHALEIMAFHEQKLDLSSSQLREVLAKPTASTHDTDLGLGLADVTSRRDQPLLGVVLFSDGQHNFGPSPLVRAAALDKLGVPIYPVVVGPRTPPSDLMVLNLKASTKVFRDATEAIQVDLKAVKLPVQEITVELQIDEQEVKPEHRHVIQHDGGDDVIPVRFQTKMSDLGSHRLHIKATSSAGKEITLANNEMAHVLRVVDDKAKILLIDGEARWEYHYLAVALARDPAIALDRVVFTQPRIGALKDAEFDKAGLAKSKLPEAKEREPLFEYDCILLGDVSPDDLPLADRRRLERYVSERGGTLVLSAGKRFLPMMYAKLPDDPIAKMLPIEIPVEIEKDAGFALMVTSEGKSQPFLQLDPSAPVFAWSDFPKHFWGVVGKRKPAASVLLTPAEDKKKSVAAEDVGLVVQQNYGLGRVLFVGIDSTWRWRFRVGDTYHHRFWGQVARWAAAEKLLPAGNRHIRFGSREPVYTQGDEIELAARLSATLPRLEGEAQLKLHKKNADGSEQVVAVVPLTVHPRQPQSLEAKVRDLAPGDYRVELDIPQYREQINEPNDDKNVAKGADLFHVLPRAHTELLDLSANWNLMQSLAERTGGQLYALDDALGIVERLARRVERVEYRDEQRPWQDEPMVWWMLGILLGLLTIEWSWRRWLELA